jgi:hypothetical protein
MNQEAPDLSVGMSLTCSIIFCEIIRNFLLRGLNWIMSKGWEFRIAEANPTLNSS